MVKKFFLMATLATTLMVWSCGNTKDKDTKDADDKSETSKTKGEETENSDDEESSNNTPEEVVKTIFKAAKTGDYSTLSGLCAGEADKDSKDICELEEKTARQEEFKEYFANGKVVGEAEIEGDQAKVNIMFGPDGDREETMNLVKEGKKWKLVSF